MAPGKLKPRLSGALSPTGTGAGHVVSLTASLLGLGSLLFLPLLEVRPNRILSGRPLFLASAPAPALLEALLPFALLLAASLFPWPWRQMFRRREEEQKPLSPLPSLAVPGAFAFLGAFAFPAILLAAALASRTALAGERASLGPAFWLSLLSAWAVMHGAWGRASAAWRTSAVLSATLGCVAVAALGLLDGLSLAVEFANRREGFFRELGRHLALAGTATLAAALLALPLAILARGSRWAEGIAFFGMGIAQTVPTLSLLGFLIIPLAALGAGGVGTAPALVALFLYALLPIAATSLAGLRGVAPEAAEAARAMGMTAAQVFFRVELPLALPSLMGGLRTALTQSMGNAVLAGLVGGGGMGSIIFLGLAQAAPDLVLLGALPVVALALASDRLMGALEAALAPGARRAQAASP